MKNKREVASLTLAFLSVGVTCAFCDRVAQAQGTLVPAPPVPGLVLNGVPQPPGLIINGKPVAAGNVSDIAATKIDLNIENGEWQDFISAIGAATPKLLSVEMRGGTRFRASLKVTNMPIGDVLRGLAGFSHCNFYMVPGRFLISPERLLRPGEKAQLIQEPAPELPALGQEKAGKPQKN